MPSDPQEWELVQKAAKGDAEAFRELVEKYHQRVLAVTTGMLHNREDALEVTQEAFIKAYRSIGDFKGDSRFYTWIHRIAVNLAIDHQRREWRRPIVDNVPKSSGDEAAVAETLLDRVADDRPGADPYKATTDAELRERVQAAVDELTPDHKAVILLREVEGLSYEEISQVMQCSKGTVMSRLHYARRKLQASLKEFL